MTSLTVSSVKSISVANAAGMIPWSQGCRTEVVFGGSLMISVASGERVGVQDSCQLSSPLSSFET